MTGEGPAIETQWVAIDFPEERAFNETYGFSGSHGRVHLEALIMRPCGRPSKTLFFFMHPQTPMDVLPVPRSLVRKGAHVMCARNRYFRNDSVLIFEKVLIDFGAWIRYAREVLGYEKVVIVGWSGGGALSVFYQGQAQRPTIVQTPAGDPVDIVGAGLIPGDAVIFQAGSVSRSRILAEAIDPSVRDEIDPSDRDRDLDIYDPANPYQPPYGSGFVLRYKAAQLARVRRITDWVKDTLDDLRRKGGKEMERCFVVHRTMADLRYMDPDLEPSDRKPRWSFSGDPETANSGPIGFARYSSLRSWLSQWSIDDSIADAKVSAATVTVPYLAIENTADDGAPAAHVREVFDACASTDKEYFKVLMANHYYAGQPDLLDMATEKSLAFLRERDLIDF